MAFRGMNQIQIANLGPDCKNIIIVGIIIRKQEPNNKDNGRSVWSFTLRDTVSDFINATVWGSADYVLKLNSDFQIGDVVNVVDPKISFRRVDEFNEKYNPFVSSAFCLMISENRSDIYMSDDDERLRFRPLLHIPTKPTDSFVNLSYIHSNVNLFCGRCVDIEVVVRDVCRKKKIVTKSGKIAENRKFFLMDESCPLFIMQSWDSIISSMADEWIPLETVLFLADVCVEWNGYMRSVYFHVTKRTVIIVNPTTENAEKLRSYARTIVLPGDTILDRDPHSITAVMSCKAVYEKAGETDQSDFSAVVYGIIHQFDIDHSVDLISCLKCYNCNMKIPTGMNVCTNSQCPSVFGSKSSSFRRIFNFYTKLVDNTGFLPNVHIDDSIARSILKCTITEYEKLTLDKQTELKWRYLLKPCVARLIISPNRQTNKVYIKVVSIEIISVDKFTTELSEYVQKK